MALPFHNGVRLDGYDYPDDQITFLLNPAILSTDIGKAVSQDGTVPNQVKLCAAGDIIVGMLSSVEARAIDGTFTGVVALEFIDLLPVQAGLTAGAVVVVGSRLEGGTAGTVRASATPNAGQPFVAEVRGTNCVAVAS